MHLTRDAREFNLFLEELCFNIFRFEHVNNDGIEPEAVHIHQEFCLGPGVHADMRIETPCAKPYYVEVEYGYPLGRIIENLQSKYSFDTRAVNESDKVIVLTDWDSNGNSKADFQRVRDVIPKHMKLEVWMRDQVFERIDQVFGVKLDPSLQDTYTLRQAVDHIKGQHAFGDDWTGDLLQTSLTWHYGYWKLKKLYEANGRDLLNIFPPKLYPSVVAVMADLSSFSAFVRDTRDMDVLRHSLTSFYHKARYEIINAGGMMYQFVGDEVVGLFGIPDQEEGYIDKAYECAQTLVDIGNAVATDWQRQIDRVQKSAGAHVGIAMGDMQFVSLRPYGMARLGAVGDSINMGARLLGEAESNQVVVSNTFYQRLSEPYQQGFEALEPVEAKNMGLIRAWKYRHAPDGN